MVSMMNFSKVLHKFVILKIAVAIIFLNWIRGLIFSIVTHCVSTIKLLKTSTYNNYPSIVFAIFLILISVFVQGRSTSVYGNLERVVVDVMN